MSRSLYSSLLLMTTLLQSLQPCCAHVSTSLSGCCGITASTGCDLHDTSDSCEVATKAVGDQCRQTSVTSRQLKCSSEADTDSSNRLPNHEHHRCPVCNGEVLNPVTKTAGLCFDANADQDTTHRGSSPIARRSSEVSDSPGHWNSSRIRSPGHLLV